MCARHRLWALAAAAVTLAACGGDDEVKTVTAEDREAVKRIERFAYAEMKRQARTTCAVIPRAALIASFRRISGDRKSYTGRPLTNNDIGLLYAERVKISPVPLQRAAYDGCIEGLRRRR